MGLCKCPKRKVTNLFCFEHRVNVCEHCLVANHSKCIVKSYLQWLQDSDYNAQCTLCNGSLSDENSGSCVRLTCYDVFHWACLNQYAQTMPAQTAPAGYQCPTCNACIFPQSNLVSPVADALKELLKQVNWARAGLGLPLIEETAQQVPPKTAPPLSNSVTPQKSDSMRSEASLDYAPGLGTTPAPQAHHGTPNAHNSSNNIGTMNSRPSAQVAPYSATPSTHPAMGLNHHSVISVDEGTTSRGIQERSGLLSNPRKLFDTTKEDELFAKSHDHDEDKYKRRPALQWLSQWFHSTDSRKRKDPNAVKKRFAVVLLIGLIGFITITIIFSKLGRQATEDDPAFDPLANPNIKVGKEEVVMQ